MAVTHEFPKTGGGTITKTLNPPFNDLTGQALEMLGFKSFEEMMRDENAVLGAVRKMDVTLDPEKREKLFETIPVPGQGSIDALAVGKDGMVCGFAGGTFEPSGLVPNQDFPYTLDLRRGT